MNKPDFKCEGCYHLGIWGCYMYCNTEKECKEHNNYKQK